MRFVFIFLAIALLSVGGWQGWQHLEATRATDAAVSVVAPLVDYREIYESGGEREANDVLLKTVAAMLNAQNAGADLLEVFARCERLNNTPTNYSDLLTESLLRNVKIARELGLDSPENIARMETGTSPVVETGPYAGEKAEVDHIIPHSIAPDISNLLINLELMPEPLNRSKWNKITERGAQIAERFYEAGVMMPESYSAVLERAK